MKTTPPGQVTDTALVLEAASVRFGGSTRWAPQNIDLSPAPGSFTVITGPSGSGKTSLALLMAGVIPHALDAVYAGSVSVHGVQLADAEQSLTAGTVALVSQDPDAQVLTSSVAEEVAYTLENLRMDAEEISFRVAEALNHCGLAGLEHRNPWTLSGGQRQRLAIACGVATHAQVIVLDQPTANVDARGREEVYALLAELADRGSAIVCCENRLDDVARHVDKVIVLAADGTVAAQGPPAELFAAPDRCPPGTLPVFARIAAACRDAGLDVGVPVSANQLDEAIVDLVRDEAVSVPDGPWPVHNRIRELINGAHRPARICPATVPDEANPVLRVSGACVGSPAAPRITGVDLTVRRGSLHALIGANGSGKTTLVTAIAGAARLRAGEIASFSADGERLHRGGCLSCCFQNPENMFTCATVGDELDAILSRSHPNGPLSRAERHALAAKLGLGEWMDANPFLLPGGLKQRLGFVATMASNRPLLLLDEPTAGQDEAGAAVMMLALTNYCERGGSALVVMHDLAAVAHHADTVTVLADGCVLADGPTADVLARPEVFDVAGLPRPSSLIGQCSLPADPTPRGTHTSDTDPSAVARHPAAVNRHSGKPFGLHPWTAMGCAVLVSLAALFSHGALAPAALFAVCCLVVAGTAGGGRRAVGRLVTAFAIAGFCGLLAVRGHFYGTTQVEAQQLWLAATRHGFLLGTVLVSAMAAGQLCSTRGLIESATVNLHLPYRWGLSALSSMTLLNYLSHEHALIRASARLRWSRPQDLWRSLFARCWAPLASALPLFVSALRLSERMSSTMTARGFGAYEDRTVLVDYGWRMRDLIVLVTCLAVGASAWFLLGR